jgi:hypothetical protein
MTELLDQVGVRWAKAGALAALEYRADPRFTTDADILVSWDDRLPGKLTDAGYSVKAMADPGEHPHLLLTRTSTDRVDLLVACTEYQDLALDRAIDGVLTVEDVIVHKLLAWRPRDQGDLRSILEVGHVLDVGYIEHWADQWEVRDRWRELTSG